MKLLKDKKGSITVEAAVAMPLFISAVLLIAFFTRVVYIHSIIQHALNDTANQLAVYEYIDRNNVLEGKGEVAALFVKPIILSNIKKSGADQNIDLSSLMVVDGNEGLNLSGSTLVDENGNIDLKISYAIRPILSVRFIPDINIFQRAVVKAWRATPDAEDIEEPDGTASEDGEDSAESDIWSLPPLSRGKKIQTMLGRNMPDYFPVVDKFVGGKITSINSINLNDITYRKPANVKNKIKGFINEIDKFNEGEYKETVIKSSDFSQKELIIVVPKDSISSEVNSILSTLKIDCETKGIAMNIIEL